MLAIQDILNLRLNELTNSGVKLVRHKDERPEKKLEYRELIKDRDKFLEYQKEFKEPYFHTCDYIVSFMGIERRKSILFGVFKVKGEKKK